MDRSGPDERTRPPAVFTEQRPVADPVSEQLWALNMELRAYFAASLGLYIERVIDCAVPPAVLEEHLARYRFAIPYIRGKQVLDIACGSGYGAHYLLTTGQAQTVVGADLDPDAIRYATHRYKKERLRFQCADACSRLADACFDVIVSFETIEHVPYPGRMLESVVEMLPADGLFLVSTPVRAYGDLQDLPSNPHHLREWSAAEFRSLLELYFGQVELFGQGWKYRKQIGFLRVSSRTVRALMRALGYASHFLDSFQYEVKPFGAAPRRWMRPFPLYLIAVCRAPRPPQHAERV